MEHTKAEPDAIRQLVRDNYGKIASAFGTCCNTVARKPCCSGAETDANRIGYSVDFTDLEAAMTYKLSDDHEKCVGRVGDGARAIAELLQDMDAKGELFRV